MCEGFHVTARTIYPMLSNPALEEHSLASFRSAKSGARVTDQCRSADARRQLRTVWGGTSGDEIGKSRTSRIG